MPTNYIDNLFKQGLQDFEATPKEQTWADILLKLYATPRTVSSNGFLKVIYSGWVLLFLLVPIYYGVFGVKPNQKVNTLSQEAILIAVEPKMAVNVANSVVAFTPKVGHYLPSVKRELKKARKVNEVKREIEQPKEFSTRIVSSPTAYSSSKKTTLEHAESNAGKASKKVFVEPSFNSSTIIEVNAKVNSPTLLLHEVLSNPWQSKEVNLPSKSINDLAETQYSRIPLKSYRGLKAESNPVISSKKTGNNQVNQETYSLEGFYFGLCGAVNTVWILNQNTYGEWGKYELGYKLKKGYSYGATVGYDIGNHGGIQLECHIKSSQGQDYEGRVKRKNYSRGVDLQYLNIPLLYKFKLPIISKEFDRPASINCLLGAQYSILKGATQKTNSQEMEITERFKGSDLAVVLGIEYNAYLSKHLFFSLGVRSTFGVFDINSKEWESQNGINRSHNSTVGVNFGINYKPF